jgi:tRNA threonylcarbamoyladenosine biosynthesis protein TsaE
VKKIISRSEADTQRAGSLLASQLRPGDVIALRGGLGMGKTVFVRGLAAGLGISDRVSSPTFALVHEYRGKIPLYHFDMYRVASGGDLESTGFFDYLGSGGICAVEWSENIADELPADCITVAIERGEGDGDRIITIKRGGAIEDTGC